MTAKLIDDCFVLDKDRLPHLEALAILKSRVHPVVGVEETPLAEAAGRFLAQAIISPRPIPAHDNAAVDGYAFAHCAYDREKGARLRVAGRSFCWPSVHARGAARQRRSDFHRRRHAERLRHRGYAGRCEPRTTGRGALGLSSAGPQVGRQSETYGRGLKGRCRARRTRREAAPTRGGDCRCNRA